MTEVKLISLEWAKRFRERLDSTYRMMGALGQMLDDVLSVVKFNRDVDTDATLHESNPVVLSVTMLVLDHDKKKVLHKLEIDQALMPLGMASPFAETLLNVYTHLAHEMQKDTEQLQGVLDVSDDLGEKITREVNKRIRDREGLPPVPEGGGFVS